ncbi:MAG: hypothetical protein ABFR75_13310 [Acidobacteriota bacterium]
MKRTNSILVLLVSISLLFVSFSNAQALKNNTLVKKQFLNGKKIFLKKEALKKSLKDLQISYELFLKNPENKSFLKAFNKALNDADSKAKGLLLLSKGQKIYKPLRNKATKGISRSDLSKLAKFSNSLMGQLRSLRNIIKNNISTNLRNINTNMKNIAGKKLQLALLEPKAEPKY